jgi:uncharacterized coiled-coil DUF342 family protein
MMPEYQKALQLASERNFVDALSELQKTLEAVEKQVGPYSHFHLFLY